ncbi:modulator of smoothened protein [Fukomys damarensis]|uniref:modulator of smoothened protein n=1 Tax=Fukomys damarensis TaxID=885580 RepID=UPI00053FA927|nr:modulator of smoothened protein [Fukomys damarensis]
MAPPGPTVPDAGIAKGARTPGASLLRESSGNPSSPFHYPLEKLKDRGYFALGALTVGLVRQCQTIHGRDRTCIPPRLPPEWVTTLFFIIMGIISLTVTCGLLVASHWRREATKYARWIAFTGMILFCMAALIFPIGFYINEVGGQPYKLPNNTVVGSSYVLFVLSIFFTIVGLLFAGKVCLPG